MEIALVLFVLASTIVVAATVGGPGARRALSVAIVGIVRWAIAGTMIVGAMAAVGGMIYAIVWIARMAWK